MTPFLLVIVGLIYTYVGLEQIIMYGNIGIGIAYMCYALSNVGLFLATPQGIEWLRRFW